jgi:hypothetical protein
MRDNFILDAHHQIKLRMCAWNVTQRTCLELCVFQRGHRFNFVNFSADLPPKSVRTLTTLAGRIFSATVWQFPFLPQNMQPDMMRTGLYH